MPRTARTRQMVEDRTQNLPGCSSLSNCWPVTTWRTGCRDKGAVDTTWSFIAQKLLAVKANRSDQRRI